MKNKGILIGVFLVLFLAVLVFVFLGQMNMAEVYSVGAPDTNNEISMDTTGVVYEGHDSTTSPDKDTIAPAIDKTISIPKDNGVRPRLPVKATAKPTPAAEENTRTVVGNLLKGNMAYYVPDSMVVNQLRRVSLTISKNMSLTELENSLEKSIAFEPQPDTTRIVSQRIKISNVMTANLYALDSASFQIRRISEKEQYVHLGNTDTTQTKWEWSVKPLKAGNQEIIIKVSAMIRDGQKERPIEFEVYNGIVPVLAVTPSSGEKISSFLSTLFNFCKENWEWIAGFITALAGLFQWLKSKFGNKQHKDQELPKVNK